MSPLTALLENWFVGWSVIPAFALMVFLRVPREERLMYEEFGEDYLKYVRRTGRIIPRLTMLTEGDQMARNESSQTVGTMRYPDPKDLLPRPAILYSKDLKC